ncbi:hypothetical protein L202_06000 [Cryptococcus amylolentus CBS 6039]|uniref:DNA mismatch repair proteins mutS family domain-containing protein n=1 Tax=Cryptococcus amylolentus CBS 6039 TaxID=1295533 RepID=A0A1E3HIU4_9TREE|nr:hypothetical protein L202_06000 [Cryptococcus amylolentus CBS 6039]ODN76055.1 hypothetical protein L202_06000 [Cryptococcus amylolentus CBS 6039]
MLLRRCRTIFRAGSRSFATSPTRLAPKTPRKASKSATPSFELSELQSTISGLKSEPLAPWSDTSTVSPSRRAKRVAHADPLEDGQQIAQSTWQVTEQDEIHNAIQSGIIPDTALAHEIFLNWKRFPDCILLTRVGKFYEASLFSYFEPARKLASILSLTLAEKSYGSTSKATKRSFPFAGFPVVGLDKYLKILVQDLGHTVVLVEEFDSEGAVAHTGKKLTAGAGPKERRVYRVVTPGTMVDEGWLDSNESRYLLAVAIGDNANEGGCEISLAYTDASTGEFFTKDTTLSQMEDELTRIAPREVVLDASLKPRWQELTSSVQPGKVTAVSDELLTLLRLLGVHVSFADPHNPPPLWTSASPEAFPISSTEDFSIALLRHHLQYALRDTMPALSAPDKQVNSAFMQIDAATLQALEIRHALRPGGLQSTGESRPSSSPLSSRGTLLSTVSKTITPSGHRLLIRTLTAPSTSLPAINSRLALVESFVDRDNLRADLRDQLKGVGDIMRIIQRFRGQRGTGRDIWDVGKWIRDVQKMTDVIKMEISIETNDTREGEAVSGGVQRLRDFVRSFSAIEDIAAKIESAIDEWAVMSKYANTNLEINEESEGLGDGLMEGSKVTETDAEKKERIKREREEKERAEWWIQPQFNNELKMWHKELASLKSEMLKLQKNLVKKHGTPTLTVERGVKFRYHLQMSKDDANKVAKARSLERMGSTTGKTAFFAHGQVTALGHKLDLTTENLANAQRRAARDLQNMVVEYADVIQRNASLVDELDLSMGFAESAVQMGWVKPVLDEGTGLHIENGRHPSVESALLSSSRLFTPNSTSMCPLTHLHVITGPNQGGKSTLLRQTAVIAILAQSGSFVPADKVEMGVVDKVFSRVGARDDLWRDRSTFMLEMVETAAILKHATDRSLVIMDEIGRGTTLQAGISIAYATLDYILQNIKCRTLFATHYHELGKMLGYRRVEKGQKESLGKEGITFWCTDVDELDGAFSYSYKLRPGINYDSHAIKAASLAGMPESFLQVAEDTLKSIQKSSPSK